jgi:hypothetical protein
MVYSLAAGKEEKRKKVNKVSQMHSRKGVDSRYIFFRQKISFFLTPTPEL